MSALDFQPDLTGHPGPAETAVSARVLGEILLVIILGIVEGRGRLDFRRDRAIPRFPEARLIGIAAAQCGLALFVRIGVDRRTVLGADVVALTQALRGIVGLPKDLEERVVACARRV